jgi:hypothetical protein
MVGVDEGLLGLISGWLLDLVTVNTVSDTGRAMLLGPLSEWLGLAVDWLLDLMRDGAVAAFGWTVLFGALLELAEFVWLLVLAGVTLGLITLVWLTTLLLVESEALGSVVGWVLDLAMVGVETGLVAGLG